MTKPWAPRSERNPVGASRYRTLGLPEVASRAQAWRLVPERTQVGFFGFLVCV